MKIKKIEVKNFKAIDNQITEFNGCSAIITAGNNKGKTSLLRGIIDRFRSKKADIILKDGTLKGYNVLELTDGSKIEWKFTEKSESFAYITKDGIKQTSGVIKAISNKYFGVEFDIDKFLNSAPKKQSKILQELVGIDLSELDSQYKIAYEERTYANRKYKELRDQNISKPVDVVNPEESSLKNEILSIKKENDQLMNKWEFENDKHIKSIIDFNNKVNKAIESKESFLANYELLKTFEETTMEKFIDFENLEKSKNAIESIEIEESKEIKNLPYPTQKSTLELDEELKELNLKYLKYKSDLKKYNDWVEDGKKAAKEKEKAEKTLKDIEEKRNELIRSAKLPEGFEFSEDWILYNGFPLNSNQISSSQRYIAGLKLGSMNLGEIKAMHFDASFLDRNSLNEVLEWADKNDYQLLIERPDFDGGEIKYEIL